MGVIGIPHVGERPGEKERDGIPTTELGDEDTGVTIMNERIANAEKIAKLFERYQALKERTMSGDQVREMVTGARKSIEHNAVTQFVSVELFDELKKTVDGLRPKSAPRWPFITGGFVIAMAIGGLIWNAATQSALTAERIGNLRDRLDRLEPPPLLRGQGAHP